eukprot:9951131-Ditylum_brightwellii.AAC.1
MPCAWTQAFARKAQSLLAPTTADNNQPHVLEGQAFCKESPATPAPHQDSVTTTPDNNQPHVLEGRALCEESLAPQHPTKTTKTTPCVQVQAFARKAQPPWHPTKTKHHTTIHLVLKHFFL